MMLGSGGYDDGYLNCSCFWGQEAGSLIKRLSDYRETVDQCHVLDAGCGEGKNAIHLARQGAVVDAWDVSEYALRNARAAWPDSHLVRWNCGDVQSAQLDAHKYDIVIMYGLLHCLDNRVAIADFISRAKSFTLRSGLHVLVAFNSRRQELEAHPGFNPTLMAHQEYLAMYREWNVLFQSDQDLHEAHPHNNIPHVHSMTRLIAQKP
jgi:SAM-dependent methyltransferase